MGWLERFTAAGNALFRPQASDNTIITSQDLERAVQLALTGGPAKSGARVNENSALGVAAVYACVRIVAETLSTLPLVLYRKTESGREPATDHPLYRVLHDQANEWQTAAEFRDTMQRDLELRGNSYAMIIRNNRGQVSELIRVEQVDVQQDDDFSLRYFVHRKNRSRIEVAPRNMFHLRGWSTDGVVGKSVVAQHRETIGDSIALQEHGSRFFSNGAKPLGVLEAEKGVKLSEQARIDLREDLNARHVGNENAHMAMIMPGGITYKPISISMEDAQYIDAKKFTRSEVFAIFGVPPHKGGDLEKATFSNIEHQGLEFVTDAIVPRAVRIEQAIQRDLIGRERGLFAKHNVNGLLRGDFKSRAEGLQVMRRNGIVSANEWRALEEMNARDDEGGDTYIIEANMRPDDGRDPTNAAAEPEGQENAEVDPNQGA